MTTIPLFQVDAFTDRAFAGNPAAVCLLDEARSDEWMAAVAAEMNLSETAFVLAVRPGFWALRWFTPTVEVALCGHATLATTWVLADNGLLEAGDATTYATQSGMLTGRALVDGRIEIELPAADLSERAPLDGLAEALGAAPVWSGASEWDVAVELESARAVRELTPDLARLRALTSPEGPHGVIVTAAGDAADVDYVCRYFAPGVGIDEDPVTGAAQCVLGLWWAHRLGRTGLIAHQVSARGGVVGVVVADDRVHLAGNAVTVFRGELSV